MNDKAYRETLKKMTVPAKTTSKASGWFFDNKEDKAMKIYIVYDSEAGHTEQLASPLPKGLKRVEGAEVFINHVKRRTSKTSKRWMR